MSSFMAMTRTNGMVRVTFRNWVRSKIMFCSGSVRIRMRRVLGRPMVRLRLIVPLALGFG